MRNSPVSVANCFVDALRLIFSAGFRRFIVIPLLLNLLIFIFLSFIALHYAQRLLTNFELYLPYWLQWIHWLLLPLMIIMLIIAYGYSFNVITTIIAAPLLGFLAEKIEARITGVIPPEESLWKLIPRTFKRELTKLIYFLPRSMGLLIVIFLLIFLPGANLLGVIVGGLWGSWCFTLQFCDYAADNHKIPFRYVRSQLGQQKLNTLTFGGIVLLGSMVPLINILITPLAVAAGTIYWTRYKQERKQVVES